MLAASLGPAPRSLARRAELLGFYRRDMLARLGQFLLEMLDPVLTLEGAAWQAELASILIPDG